MNIPARRRSTALIIHAHPEPESFSRAQAQVACESLGAQGYAVELIDLYARKWDPVLTCGEFPSFAGAFKPQREQQNAFVEGALSAEVEEDLDRVLAADLLVLSFPLWWFSLPAILEGWLDRVFVMGAVSGGDAGVFETAVLSGKRAVVLATTGGSAEMFTETGLFGSMDAFLFHIHRGVFEFVGSDALEPVVTYGLAHLDQPGHIEALEEVELVIDRINKRASAATSRSGRRSDAILTR